MPSHIANATENPYSVQYWPYSDATLRTQRCRKRPLPSDRSVAYAVLTIGFMPTMMVSQSETVRELLAEHAQRESERREAFRRVEADYREMPGLSVTLPQGCRLWSLSQDVCASILDQMIQRGQLKRRGEQYSLR
jgi:hypothetical protein